MTLWANWSPLCSQDRYGSYWHRHRQQEQEAEEAELTCHLCRAASPTRDRKDCMRKWDGFTRVKQYSLIIIARLWTLIFINRKPPGRGGGRGAVFCNPDWLYFSKCQSSFYYILLLMEKKNQRIFDSYYFLRYFCFYFNTVCHLFPSKIWDAERAQTPLASLGSFWSSRLSSEACWHLEATSTAGRKPTICLVGASAEYNPRGFFFFLRVHRTSHFKSSNSCFTLRLDVEPYKVLM